MNASSVYGARVRSEPWTVSRSAPKPMRIALSCMAALKASESMSPAPSSRRPAVMPARPGLAAGVEARTGLEGDFEGDDRHRVLLDKPGLDAAGRDDALNRQMVADAGGERGRGQKDEGEKSGEGAHHFFSGVRRPVTDWSRRRTSLAADMTPRASPRRRAPASPSHCRWSRRQPASGPKRLARSSPLSRE